MLIDTRALLRTLQVQHPHHEIVTRALEILPDRGRNLHIVPQNRFELWVVATRPIEQNGLGMSVTVATAELWRLKSMFPLLPDTPAIYPFGKTSFSGMRSRENQHMMRAWSPRSKCMG